MSRVLANGDVPLRCYFVEVAVAVRALLHVEVSELEFAGLIGRV